MDLPQWRLFLRFQRSGDHWSSRRIGVACMFVNNCVGYALGSIPCRLQVLVMLLSIAAVAPPRSLPTNGLFLRLRTIRFTILRSTLYFLLSDFSLEPEMGFAFEKLLVYQKAIAFADAVCTITRNLPRGYFFLGDQLSRASLSIASNIAEGNGRFTKPDRRNFFGIARGSVQECVPLLELAERQGLLKPEIHSKLKAELEEIARMLSGLINGLENRKI